MSKITEAAEAEDHILDEIANFAPTLADEVEASEDHAMLIIGVKYTNENDKVGEGVQTYISAAGYYGILAEGLYAELADQLENGQTALYAILRDVIPGS
jgi:hypothetical protein